MTGYVRTDTTNNIADGNIISATDLDNEFDGIQAAFNSSTGHNHDGTTGEGAPILVLGPTQDVVVGAAAVTPKTTNTVDIGSGSLKFKDLWLAGNANFAGTTTLGGALTYGGVTLSNAVTGTGNMVLSASPTLVTPALGTPSSATLTNATGLPVATGISGLGSGVATFLATPSSANLAAAVTDETGTGALVFANSPTFVTPALGTPASGVVTNLTGTASININGTVGATTPTTGAFTTLTTSGNTTLGDASTDTVQVNGYMGVGGAGDSRFAIYASSSALTGTGQEGARFQVVGSSAATSYIRGVNASISSAAASFTVSDASDFYAGNIAKGAGSTITNAHGIYIADQTNGTNNYGITSLVSSGTNKWNIYASGTAANYFAGNVGIGDTTATSVFGATVRIGTTSIGGTLQLPGGRIYTAASTNQLNISGGIGSDGAVVFLRSSSGSESMRIDSAGNVGIGTSSPTTLLDLRGTLRVDGGGNSYIYSDASGVNFETVGNRFTRFYTNGSERLRIDSAGNVGIGTSSPGAKVQVNGGANPYVVQNSGLAIYGIDIQATAGGSGAFGGALSFGNGGSGRAAISGVQGTADSDTVGLSFFVHSSSVSVNDSIEAARFSHSGGLITYYDAVFNEDGIDADFRVESDTNTHALFVQGSDGNVGIGTSSPLDKLDITNGWIRVTSGYGLRFGGTNNSIYASATSNLMSFNTNGTERLRIDSVGNVGIGTSSPTSKIHVFAGAEGTVARFTGASVDRGLIIKSETAGQFSNLNTIDSTSAGGAGILAFATDGSERLRIDSAGNVGIGTSSPSASAILDAQSTTKGVRMPNMTTTQKNAIASPAAGLMVFDTTLAKLCVYTGAAWETITSI